MKNLIWLASYPKSGNTWLRILLESIIYKEGNTVDINQMNLSRFGFVQRFHLDQFMEADSTELTIPETYFYKRAYYLDFGSKAKEDTFLKTHDANIPIEHNHSLIPEEVTKLAIYIVRNPLDIVASLANHLSISLDDAIDSMADKKLTFFRTKEGITSNVDQPLTDWSGHVRSWLDSRELPVILVKYEDLLQAPVKTLKIVLRAMGKNKIDEHILNRALENNSFTKLVKQESERGFQEKAVQSPVFFRKGKSGSWQEELTNKQVSSIVKVHGTVMASLGYLPHHKPTHP